MSTITTSSKPQQLALPTPKKYNPAYFSYIFVILAPIFFYLIFDNLRWFALFVFVGIIQYIEYQRQFAAARSEYNEQVIRWNADPANRNANGEPLPYPEPFVFQATDGEGNPLFPTFILRTSLQYLVTAALLYFIIIRLLRNFGPKRVIIDENGITIKQFQYKELLKEVLTAPIKILQNQSFDISGFKTVKYIPWAGVLDVTVKQSESILTSFSSRLQKASLYTMDGVLTIEQINYTNSSELMEQLRAFGDSLEEKVLDFGYGAFLAVVWRRMKRSKVGVLGMVLVVFFLFTAFLAAVASIQFPLSDVTYRGEPILIHYFDLQLPGGTVIPVELKNPNFQNFGDKSLSPRPKYWFGTDSNGRDIFSRVFFGTFYSVLIGIVAQTIVTVIGGLVGAASGYMGGSFDNVAMRISDVLLVLPGLPILLLISTSFGPVFEVINIEGAYFLVVYSIFSLLSWATVARYTRAEVLALKESEFIQAEHVLGATHWRIITRHILPNSMSTLIIIFTLGVAGTIQSVAGLAFLGFGTSDTLVWGSDLSDYATDTKLITDNQWWGVTFVSMALFLLTLGFNLMGDALRDALDPRLKE